MKKTIEEKNFNYKRINREYLLETHVSMFEYSNLPETVNPFFLELYLQLETMVVWLKDKRGDIIAIEGSRAGDLDVYGLGRDIIAVTRNGESYQLKDGIDCIVGYNNRSMSACGDIYTDADTMSDIRTSIDFLIFWTRLSPLIRTADEKTKLKVIEAFRNIQKGVPVTLASKKILADFGINDDIDITNLTQPDFADKIQYTSKLYDDVIRWHFTKYGQAIHGDGKAAQESVDEVNSTTSQSLVLPLSMLKVRREMIDKVNAMWDLNITVELSGAWRAEVTDYENETGEGSIDESKDDTLSTEPAGKETGEADGGSETPDDGKVELDEQEVETKEVDEEDPGT